MGYKRYRSPEGAEADFVDDPDTLALWEGRGWRPLEDAEAVPGVALYGPDGELLTDEHGALKDPEGYRAIDWHAENEPQQPEQTGEQTGEQAQTGENVQTADDMQVAAAIPWPESSELPQPSPVQEPGLTQ